MSAVVIRVHDNIQKSIYYVSKTLLDTETRHLTLEKVALALIHGTMNFLFSIIILDFLSHYYSHFKNFSSYFICY